MRADHLRRRREDLLAVFFAAAACSWVPHWACHYYRIETDSTFVVGSWEFSKADSILSMLVYSAMIGLNLVAVVWTRMRGTAALLTGILHLALAAVHSVRLIAPFRFEVMGYPWSPGSSMREVIMVGLFGLACLWVSWISRRTGSK